MWSVFCFPLKVPKLNKTFETLLTTERKITGQWFLAVAHSPTFLNTGTTDETFQKSGKQNSFRQIEKGSASMYASLGSHFFRTTTEKKSGPADFEMSRLVMIFLIKLRVTWILFSFKLVLEGKTGNEIPDTSRFEFLENLFANSFTLSEAEENTSGPLDREGIVDSP